MTAILVFVQRKQCLALINCTTEYSNKAKMDQILRMHKDFYRQNATICSHHVSSHSCLELHRISFHYLYLLQGGCFHYSPKLNERSDENERSQMGFERTRRLVLMGSERTSDGRIRDEHHFGRNLGWINNNYNILIQLQQWRDIEHPQKKRRSAATSPSLPILAPNNQRRALLPPYHHIRQTPPAKTPPHSSTTTHAATPTCSPRTPITASYRSLRHPLSPRLPSLQQHLPQIPSISNQHPNADCGSGGQREGHRSGGDGGGWQVASQSLILARRGLGRKWQGIERVQIITKIKNWINDDYNILKLRREARQGKRGAVCCAGRVSGGRGNDVHDARYGRTTDPHAEPYQYRHMHSNGHRLCGAARAMPTRPMHTRATPIHPPASKYNQSNYIQYFCGLQMRKKAFATYNHQNGQSRKEVYFQANPQVQARQAHQGQARNQGYPRSRSTRRPRTCSCTRCCFPRPCSLSCQARKGQQAKSCQAQGCEGFQAQGRQSCQAQEGRQEGREKDQEDRQEGPCQEGTRQEGPQGHQDQRQEGCCQEVIPSHFIPESQKVCIMKWQGCVGGCGFALLQVF